MADPLTAAACAYVLARETGRPTESLYRALRRAWVARVRAERLDLRKPKPARTGPDWLWEPNIPWGGKA